MTPAVRLIEYDPSWPARFDDEARRIAEAVDEHAIAIEHYGSTSIPGMVAKPTIDIQLGVKDLSVVEVISPSLSRIGYEFAPELIERMPGRMFFGKGPRGAADFHLHVVEWGSVSWEEPLLFRDRLRRDPEAANEYRAIKLMALETGDEDRNKYSQAKKPFIRSIVEAEWRAKRARG